MRTIPKLLLLALIVLTAGSLPPAWGRAVAHGGGVEIFRGTQGAYEIIVGMRPETPVVGSMHFSVTPRDPATKTLLLNVQITIVAHDPSGEPAYQVRAVNSPLVIEFYDANITIESPGDWTLQVKVHREALGTETFVVPLSVGEQGLTPSNVGTVVWLAVLGTLAGGAIYVWYRSRKALRGPDADQKSGSQQL